MVAEKDAHIFLGARRSIRSNKNLNEIVVYRSKAGAFRCNFVCRGFCANR